MIGHQDGRTSLYVHACVATGAVLDPAGVDKLRTAARVTFVDPSSESWAAVHHQPGAGEYQVHQAGPRRLWDEVAAAYQWWLDTGSPKSGQWRITVTLHEQLVALG